MSRRSIKPKPKAYRFGARLSAEQKILIEKAAALTGQTMTEFVLRSAEAAARCTIEEKAVLVLSPHDTEMFVDAILHPADPGRVLRAAANHYKRTLGR
jgi:uncharacterized protein (DUF1778 family)